MGRKIAITGENCRVKIIAGVMMLDGCSIDDIVARYFKRNEITEEDIRVDISIEIVEKPMGVIRIVGDNGSPKKTGDSPIRRRRNSELDFE